MENYTDPDDIMFAEVFITSNTDALITGNLRHYKALLKENAMVPIPAQFVRESDPFSGCYSTHWAQDDTAEEVNHHLVNFLLDKISTQVIR